MKTLTGKIVNLKTRASWSSILGIVGLIAFFITASRGASHRSFQEFWIYFLPSLFGALGLAFGIEGLKSSRWYLAILGILISLSVFWVILLDMNAACC
jgi:hypothetical protein